jgi:Uma2 family endonuclease
MLKCDAEQGHGQSDGGRDGRGVRQNTGRPPDLAIEVRSPEGRHTALHVKAAEYLSYGVRLVWLLYPSERIATVFAPGLVPVVLQSDQSLTGADVVPGFSCRVAELFTLP